jgi:hypothetical protein
MSSNIFDLINFLFKRKYGHISLAPYPITPLGSPMSPNDDLNEKSHNKLLGKVKAYKSELAALPREELEALVKIELQKQEALDKIESEKRKQEDARLFFNEPKSQAVFMDWGIQAYWTHEEAAALFIGKNPKAVTRKKMQPFSSEELLEHHSVSREYHKRLELFGRAIELNLLSIKSSPLDYAIYARSNNLEIPAGLIESFSDQSKVAFEKLFDAIDSNASSEEPTAFDDKSMEEKVHKESVNISISDSNTDEQSGGIELAFDPIPLSGIASMFQLNKDLAKNTKRWSDYARKAAEEGMEDFKSARVETGSGTKESTFNPLLVGRWLPTIKKGLTNEKVNRILRNNLPERSRELCDEIFV